LRCGEVAAIPGFLCPAAMRDYISLQLYGMATQAWITIEDGTTA